VKILIVDDSQLIRTITAEALREIGIKKIIEVRNGQEALDHLAYNNVDLIIMDLNMPVMDGIECIKRLRETDKDTPIIVCSAGTERGLIKKVANLGISGYLAKPYTLQDLKKKIDYISKEW